MKSPEEMAEEYLRYENESYYWAKHAFHAGYKAAKDQLADTDKVMPQWISVKERLPEITPTQGMNYWLTSTCVLIATKEKTRHVAHLTHWTREPEADWAACACDTPGHDVEPERWKLSDVTHWMPLPEAPKEGK